LDVVIALAMFCIAVFDEIIERCYHDALITMRGKDKVFVIAKIRNEKVVHIVFLSEIVSLKIFI